MDEIVERMRESFWREPTMFGSSDGYQLAPAVDETEDDKAYHIAVDLPGLHPNDVDVSLADNVRTIRGEKKPGKCVMRTCKRVDANELMAHSEGRSLFHQRSTRRALKPYSETACLGHAAKVQESEGQRSAYRSQVGPSRRDPLCATQQPFVG